MISQTLLRVRTDCQFNITQIGGKVGKLDDGQVWPCQNVLVDLFANLNCATPMITVWSFLSLINDNLSC